MIRRDERTRTTWALKLGLLALAVLVLWLTRSAWTAALAGGLVCDEDLSRSDALLVENFDSNYPLFERAAMLVKTGVAARVLVPVWTDSDTARPDAVALGTTDLMARIARLEKIETVPIPQIEPVSLNAAYHIRDYLQREKIRSVTVVPPLYRSRRSAMVYAATLVPAGITVRCAPARGPHFQAAWTKTWHGIQDVTVQWVKLLYYRVYVLPTRVASISRR